MQVGIDSYSYHRRYGEVRIGEVPSAHAPWAPEPGPVLRHAAAVGAEIVFLETCYLPDPEAIDADLLGRRRPGRPGRLLVGPSLAGRPLPRPRRRPVLRRRARARALDRPDGPTRAGRPAHHGGQPGIARRRAGRSPRRAARRTDPARGRPRGGTGIRLALENHGDLRVQDILELFERVDRPATLGVCLDNVNLPRVGDDMAAGTRALAPYTLLVQLKDHRAGDPTVPGGPVCTALGEGVADLPGLIAILDDAAFDGPVCVELASLGGDDVDELAMVERSLDWLRANLPRD